MSIVILGLLSAYYAIGAFSNSSNSIKNAVEDSTIQRNVYTCPMHPEVQQSEPGQCPKCGMELVLKENPPGDNTNVAKSDSCTSMEKCTTSGGCSMGSCMESGGKCKMSDCGNMKMDHEQMKDGDNKQHNHNSDGKDSNDGHNHSGCKHSGC